MKTFLTIRHRRCQFRFNITKMVNEDFTESGRFSVRHFIDNQLVNSTITSVFTMWQLIDDFPYSSGVTHIFLNLWVIVSWFGLLNSICNFLIFLKLTHRLASFVMIARFFKLSQSIIIFLICDVIFYFRLFCFLLGHAR